MKAALKTDGPLHIGIDSTNDLYGSVANMIAKYKGPSSSMDHEVVVVGYVDDDALTYKGYWIVKNSWGTGYGDGGYEYVPYGSVGIHNDINNINGPVYYTGAMVSATWKGGSGSWQAGRTNWSGVDNVQSFPTPVTIPSYAWENKETSATFNASASGTNITLVGKVIAHGLTVSSGATGYVFSGTASNGSLTVTGGGINANESVSIYAPVTIGDSASMDHRQRKKPDHRRQSAYGHQSVDP